MKNCDNGNILDAPNMVAATSQPAHDDFKEERTQEATIIRRTHSSRWSAP
jgi:hypothetical protein